MLGTYSTFGRRCLEARTCRLSGVSRNEQPWSPESCGYRSPRLPNQAFKISFFSLPLSPLRMVIMNVYISSGLTRERFQCRGCKLSLDIYLLFIGWIPRLFYQLNVRNEKNLTPNWVQSKSRSYLDSSCLAAGEEFVRYCKSMLSKQ